jgi:hypothetical protein
MKINDRLADYIVIGGFFWTVQLIFFFVLVRGRLTSFVPLSGFISTIPGAVTTLAGVFALIIVFSSGIFIDLFAAFYFRSIEAGVFQAHAKANAAWIEPFLGQYADYVQDGWKLLMAVPESRGSFLTGLKLGFQTLWSRKIEEEIDRDSKATIAARKPYMRMHSFLFSWLSLVAGADHLELLNAQMSFWSVSRAFAITFIIASVETVILFMFLGFRVFGSFVMPIFVMLSVQIACMLAAMMVSKAAYSRFCSTLFALCYVANKRDKLNK